jgi:hypothetical protein
LETPLKPKPVVAMQHLIETIRASIPFDEPASSYCQGPCQGCAKKLIEFLDDELSHWQTQLSLGESPKLGDISTLAHKARKIYRVLRTNGIVTAPIDQILSSDNRK